ncbi:myo-inositol-1(or 4)-monophosphatase [Metarhizium brunneum]
MDRPYAKELATSFRALQRAAQLSQSIASAADKGVLEKDDLSPVTVADFAIQALLIATFRHAFPGDRFVGEEDASGLRRNEPLLSRVWDLLRETRRDEDEDEDALPQSREHVCQLIDLAASTAPGGKGSGRTWVFDPIDGTRTYVRGELYAINVALLVDGEQVLGSVGCPNMSMNAAAPLGNRDIDPLGRGCIVFAVRGHGAYVRSMAAADDAVVRPLSAAREGDVVRFVTCVGMADSALDGVHEAVADRLGAAFPGCDLVPWVLRWATLALGLGNTTVWVYKRRDRYAKVWDHAGAMLLFQETGGKITDVLGRRIDLAAGRKLSANFGFVAAPEHLHGRVLDAVHQVLRDQGHGDMLTA